MSTYLHIKKFICKVLTCWMPSKQRILYREALYWFSLSDYIRFKRANYHIVSLGSNCLPRGLTTAIKLKPRRFYGEKSCPFDFWNNSDINKTIQFIESDFANFFENIAVNEINFPHDYALTIYKFIYETGWLVYMINEYSDYDNKYTQYVRRMKKNFSMLQMLKNH